MLQIMNYVKGKRAAVINLAKLKRKDLGGKEVIVEVALIVVAVALAIIFRDNISAVVSSLITSAQTKITGIFS